MTEIEKLALLAQQADELLALREEVKSLKDQVANMKQPYGMTTKEAAELLQVDAHTVVVWAKQGKIPCIRSRGGYRYPSHDLFRFAEGHRS